MGKGHLFQAKCWEKYPRGHHLFCFMAKGKLEKEMAKALKRKKCIFAHYLWKQWKENEGERSQVSCEEENEGKWGKNEENKDINDKMDSEDKFIAFCLFSVRLCIKEDKSPRGEIK